MISRGHFLKSLLVAPFAAKAALTAAPTFVPGPQRQSMTKPRDVVAISVGSTVMEIPIDYITTEAHEGIVLPSEMTQYYLGGAVR